ncbi:unnamed protein product [Sordaria macrospora k-hell]|uniref:WGS project CABT00000000 data, contig 2.15 n=1 Tax=Sordaria macrospora (strain ATCC MYA-333 / DSM 997 / K(L3346) / K-hell) TaxID=771870 RepID=F7VZJ2_SORMK|nr:uncharacterized protein SMAC_04169 [Sordaria macrospora k-hell]CCC10940.1 unnamed protein product [Sordaria macrospora k-hell]
MAATKMTKNQMRRAKKKEQKKAQAEDGTKAPETETTNGEATTDVKDKTANEDTSAKNETTTADSEVKKEDSPQKVEVDGSVDDKVDVELSAFDEDPAFAAYKNIFDKFGMSLDEDDVAREANAGNKGEVFFDQDDEIPSEEEDAGKLSKKKRKKLNKLSIAELKALVKNPEVVEWQDVSSPDPRLLVQIKAQRNIVPVPSHWSLKREYLSSKRGVEKPPFKLPKFIAETGITEMRDAVLEKQAEQTLKQKQRERVQPKMGKLDIDYQKLYDAFFRHQTKPDLTRFGDVYYEGKEWEADYKVFRAGEVSDALREALGMQPGFPPPWLLQQQRVGPPPSYPTLKIPGLNAPLPPGASWGFQPGQWGKPPLDERCRPLPTPQFQAPAATAVGGEPVERTLWGELQPPAEESEEEESDEEDEDEEEEEDGDIPPGGTETSISQFDAGHPSGYASSMHPGGEPVESSMAGEFDLRKTRRGYETEESAAPRSAYQVIPERQRRAEGFFGSDKTYELASGRPGGGPGPAVPVLGRDDDDSRKRKKPGDVEVALDPDLLAAQAGLSKEELRKRYEAGRKEEGPGAQWASNYDEDLSDMIAQESRKRQKREEERREERKGGRR